MLFPKLSVRNTLLASVLLAAAGAVGFWGYRYFNETPPLVDYRNQLRSEQVQHDAKIKITADTIIHQKMIYQKCGDQENLRSRPSEQYVGMTLADIQSVYPGWTIDYFDAVEVRMTLPIDDLCREHANGMYIGIKDGYVTVFYGNPDSKPIVREVTNIPIKRLVSEDIAELKKGIVVHSKEELLRTLEGMHSQ